MLWDHIHVAWLLKIKSAFKCQSIYLHMMIMCLQNSQHLNTLGPRQNGRHFPDAIFKCIFFNENVWIVIKISLKFVPRDPIKNIPALVQIRAWHRPGDKPSFLIRWYDWLFKMAIEISKYPSTLNWPLYISVGQWHKLVIFLMCSKYIIEKTSLKQGG